MSNSAPLINEKASTNPNEAENQVAAHQIIPPPEMEKSLVDLLQRYPASTSMTTVKITEQMPLQDMIIDPRRRP